MEKSAAPLGVFAAVAGLALLGLVSTIGFGSAAEDAPQRGPQPASLPGTDAALVVLANRSVEVEQLLGHSLSGMLGGASGERLARLEAALSPIFSVLPKSGGSGTVNQAVASYALHRFFASFKAWTFKEFKPKGSQMFSQKGARIESKVADLVADVLEGGTDSKAFSLQDLVVLAATVEDLVQGENLEQLTMAYRAAGLSVSEPLNLEQRRLVLDAFVVILLGGKDSAHFDEERDVAAVREAIEKVREDNPIVADTLIWVADFEKTIRDQDRMQNPFATSGKGSWGFASMADLVEDVVSKIGWVQSSDCSMTKNFLLDLEDVADMSSVSGSVDVEIMYEHHLSRIGLSRSQSTKYLTLLGALDVRDPKKPRAVVSNYVYASQMCTTTPGALKMCCINECNALMGSLERSIARPAATPEVVRSIVASLPSASIAAPRKLPGFLLRGLDRIADQHGGQVPLHSRVFARWMHRAFPGECPNPAIPGAEHAPWVGEAFVESLDGGSGLRGKKRARQHKYDASSGGNESGETDDFLEAEEAEEEELAVVAETPAHLWTWASVVWVCLRVVALAAIVFTSGVSMRRHVAFVRRALGSRDAKKDDDLFI